MKCYIALVHYPVYDKAGETITSGITNLDLHDIARTATTYGIKDFYIIHPNEKQKQIFQKILAFWKSEIATFYNPHRVEALTKVKMANSIEETIKLIKNQEKDEPIIITTTAQKKSKQKCFLKTRKLLDCTEKPALILFGTANGLHNDIHKNADIVLKPIQANANYNHLSVRSAVAIVLDRLFSEEYRRQ